MSHFLPKESQTGEYDGFAFSQQVEEVVRHMAGHIQHNQGVSKAGEVLQQRVTVELLRDQGGQPEHADRDQHGNQESDGEGHIVAGGADRILQPGQDGGPGFQHGHILDKDDAHDDCGEEGFLQFGLADEPQFPGWRAHGELDRIIGAVLDTVGANVAVRAGGHCFGELKERAAIGFFRTFEAGSSGAGGANLRGAAQFEHPVAGVVARKPAQEADVTAEGAALKECARGHHAGRQGHQQDARTKRVFHNAPDMVTPGNEDKERVDDPDAVFLEELWHRTVIAREFLHQVIEGGKGTDGAPETSQEQEHDRDDRPPEHPGQRRAEVVVRR